MDRESSPVFMTKGLRRYQQSMQHSRRSVRKRDEKPIAAILQPPLVEKGSEAWHKIAGFPALHEEID